MNDVIRWALKLCLHGVLWVFLLSIRIDGKAAFYYAHDILVQNAVVEAVDGELFELWQRVARSTRAVEDAGEKEGKSL